MRCLLSGKKTPICENFVSTTLNQASHPTSRLFPEYIYTIYILGIILRYRHTSPPTHHTSSTMRLALTWVLILPFCGLAYASCNVTGKNSPVVPFTQSFNSFSTRQI